MVPNDLSIPPNTRQYTKQKAHRQGLVRARQLDEPLHRWVVWADEAGQERLLSDLFGLCGELPISAQTYLHCFTGHSANALALPLRQGGNLTSFQNIHVPMAI